MKLTVHLIVLPFALVELPFSPVVLALPVDVIVLELPDEFAPIREIQYALPTLLPFRISSLSLMLNNQPTLPRIWCHLATLRCLTHSSNHSASPPHTFLLRREGTSLTHWRGRRPTLPRKCPHQHESFSPSHASSPLSTLLHTWNCPPRCELLVRPSSRSSTRPHRNHHFS